MNDEQRAEFLQHREEMYRAAVDAAEHSRLWRNEAIRGAIAAGWTHAQVAKAMGLTRSRVGQLAQD